MITELNFQNHHAFVCDISHYDELLEIGKSQPNVHGVAKTPTWYAGFNAKLKSLLKATNDQLFVSAVRNTTTGQLISYMITSIPYNESCFTFFKFGETRKIDTIFSDNNGTYKLWKLSLMNSVEKGSFDAFFTIHYSAYRPLMREIKKCSYLDNNGSMYNWQLNSIVMPEEYSKTSIQEILIPSNPNMLERKYPIAICHASLKPEHRVRQFSNFFKDKTEIVSNESIQD